jgi:chromosome transmission fidelity protein 4
MQKKLLWKKSTCVGKIPVPELTSSPRLARRSMFLDIARDALGDELTTQDIGTRETELDIEIIKLLGKACSSNVDRPTRQARALDLVRMIHNPAIFPSAIKLAQFYKLRGLEDRINQLKDLREEEDRQHTARDRRREWAGDVAAVPPPRNLVQTITNVNGARAFGDFAPPPASSRLGLARAKPSTAQPFTTSSTHQSPSTSTWDLHDDEDGPPAPDGEPKRKRTPQDELGSTEAKRRAVAPVAALSERNDNRAIFYSDLF